MGTPQHALHRTVLAVDVSSFGRRASNGQGETRRGLYAALVGAFDACGLDFAATHHEDRGDGVLVLIPPDVAKSRLVRLLPEALAGELRRHNATHHEDASIRLRVAITAGEVRHDEHGVVGGDVNLAFRLLDAEPLRRALERTDDVLALILSRRFHEDVVRDDPAVPAGSFRRVEVRVKEVRDHAWLRVTGPVAAPVAAPGSRHRSRHRRRRPTPRRAAAGLVAVLLGIAVTDASAAAPPVVPPCPAPVQLVVLTSRDKEPAVTNTAVEFEEQSRGFTERGCKGASVQVTTGSSAHGAAAALAGGWEGGQDLTEQGAQPHVWLPDASFEVDRVLAALERSPDVRVRLDRRPPIARSPVVVGASPELAERIGEGDRDVRWSAVDRVAAPDASEGAGVAAVAALVHGRLGGVPPTAPGAALALRGLVRRGAAGTPPCTGDVVLVAPEQEVAGTRGCRLLYPGGGLVVLDHPFVAVRWAALPENPRRQRVVDLFEAHLRDDGAQAAFRREGFRDANGAPGLVGEPRPGPPPDVVEVGDGEALRRAWAAAVAPVAVAVVSDGSPDAVAFAASLEGLLGPGDRLDAVAPGPGSLEEAVRREAGAVVLLAASPAPRQAPGTSAPVRVVAVGFGDGACDVSTALYAAAKAHDGDCAEVDASADPQSALETVARGIWGV
ncbi:substrate-binding domain-containing protein [Saccharothrix sp. Mg75]|uniref:substrate-binding domain-containing protein n=1 Tax=Saccharothrix sp. Mg75 TaxID=3445357 RepID=UPI003EEED97F